MKVNLTLSVRDCEWALFRLGRLTVAPADVLVGAIIRGNKPRAIAANSTKTCYEVDNKMTDWKKTFEFKGKKLYYNRILYNNPSERAVEVPIGFDFLAANVEESNRVLEVGNVLSYYENTLSEEIGIISRKIVDKFEKGVGVENKDLMELNSVEKYNTVVSISTVEHIGQEVAPMGAYGEHIQSRDREAPLKAIVKIYDLLAVNGKALITVPFGLLTDFGWYIQFSGQYLALLYSKYGIPKEAVSTRFLKLIDRDPSNNEVKMFWEECDSLEVTNCEYGYPFPTANAIVVIELSKVLNDFHLNLNVESTPLFYNMPYKERTGVGQDKEQWQQIQTELEKYKQLSYQIQTKVEIISVHVPKTAGPTFVNVLSQVYGTEAVFMDNENDPTSQIKPFDLPPHIKAIHGHFHLDKYNGYFPNAKRVIWLRNPVIRLISNYFFWRDQEFGVPEDMDVLGIQEFARLPGIQNLVANYIGKNQLSDFYFVGINEFLESDLEDLRMMMGWPNVSVSVANDNTFSSEYKKRLKKILDNRELVKQLAQSNSLDMELYQQALNLRANRRNELGGFHQILQLSEHSQSQLHQTQEELETSQSQLHQTQEELETSQSQLYQTQADLEHSQSQLHQTQEELETSQSQLYQTQADLEHSQSRLHQTQEELSQTKSLLCQTQGEWQNSQSQLHQTQEELSQTKSLLCQTQEELETSQSQLHQTQEELETSQSQLHQTQEELETSQSQLHQTQEELETSQSQLHQTQEELSQTKSLLCQTQRDWQNSQSQLHQTQEELNQYQLQLYQIKRELKRSQSQFYLNLTELQQSQSQLHQTQEEWQQSQSQLHQIQKEWQQSQSQLHLMRGELKRTQFQFHQTLVEIETVQAQLHQKEVAFEQSQAQLHQKEVAFEQSQSQLHQKEVAFEQSQSQLHQLQRELEYSRFSHAKALQTNEKDQTDYQLLVWEAWYSYRNGDRKQMVQHLKQSLKHSRLSKTETVSNWLETFSRLSAENGDYLDASSLVNTVEWLELTRQIVTVKKVFATS